MKKIFSVLLILILALAMAGCNPEQKDPQGSETDEFYQEDAGINKDKIVGKIVDNGRSSYIIVISQAADPAECYAAEELQKFLLEVTGAYLVIESDTAASGNVISLGRNALFDAQNFAVDFGKLNGEGFVMKQKEQNLFIAGENSTGTLNGVYDFCENYLGIRFLTKSATHLVKQPTVPLYETDRISVPAFSGRDHYSYQTMNDKEFSARLRLNCNMGKIDMKFGATGAAKYYVGDGHTNLETLLIPDEYPDKPHWYNTGKSELCYTDGITPEGIYDDNYADSMVNGMLAVCKEVIRNNNTGAKYLMLGQPDNNEWCTCADCRASDAKYGKSGTLMIFVNSIAEQLAKWKEQENIDKEIIVMTFAYWKTIAPPTKVVNGEIVLRDEKVRARDDVAIKFAHRSCNYHALYDENCRTNVEFNNYIKGWRMVADNFTIWDYNTNFRAHFFWYPNFGSLIDNYKYYIDIGAEQVMTQGAPHVYRYYQGHLENYMVSKLLWAPNRDLNAIVEEFNALYFGSSASVVNKFVNLMNNHCASLAGTTNSFCTEVYDTRDFLKAFNYPKGLLETAMMMIFDEIDRVNADTEMDATEKTERIDRLLEVYIMPQYMTLRNYESYYEPTTKRDFAISFFENTDRLGIEYYGENLSIRDLKRDYQIA